MLPRNKILLTLLPVVPLGIFLVSAQFPQVWQTIADSAGKPPGAASEASPATTATTTGKPSADSDRMPAEPALPPLSGMTAGQAIPEVTPIRATPAPVPTTKPEPAMPAMIPTISVPQGPLPHEELSRSWEIHQRMVSSRARSPRPASPPVLPPQPLYSPAPPSPAISVQVSDEICEVPPFSVVELVSATGRSGYRNLSVPADQVAEMHVVSSYEGSGTVNVARSSKPIVLYLSSYETSRWTVRLEDGAEVSRVYVSSIRTGSHVLGLPENTEVIQRPYDGYSDYWQREVQGMKYMPDEFKDTIGSIRCSSDLSETSYQSIYGIGGTFSVPPRPPFFTEGETFGDVVTPRSSESPADDVLIAGYEYMLDSLPEPHRRNAELLVAMMKEGKLPAMLIDGNLGPDPDAPRVTRPWAFPTQAASAPAGMTACDPRTPGRDVTAWSGSDSGSTIECSWGEQWYTMGTGKDVIDDSWGSDVIDGGEGNDILGAGWGTDVIVFNEGFGKDTVSKTCHTARVPGDDAERLGWKHEFTDFLVFGKGLHPIDFTWMGEELVHVPTGDSVMVKGKCFNLAFMESGAVTEPEMPRPPQPQRSTRVPTTLVPF